MKDAFGYPIEAGCYVVYARSTNHATHLNVGRVTKVGKTSLNVLGATRRHRSSYERHSQQSTITKPQCCLVVPEHMVADYIKDLLKDS